MATGIPSISDVFNDVASWSNATFGDEASRGPIGPLKHLVKEVQNELLPPTGDPKKLDEYADVLILWCDAVRRAGFCCDDALIAAKLKMSINRTRNYPKPLGDAISEHIRD